VTAIAPPAIREERAVVAVAMIPTSRLRMHPRNIRRTFTDLDELAASIRHEGVIEPLVAHQRYIRGPGVQDLELIAGHRRLAAAEIAGLRRVPVVVVPRHTDDEAMLAMLAENTARVAVEPADLGRAVTTLHEEFSYSYAAIAERLGLTLDDLQAWRKGRLLGVRRRRSAPATGNPRPVAAPKLRPKALHELLVRWDADEVDALELVAELRGWLGDWTPKDPGGSP
jgi:ParB family chromosome partitioning protein